MTVEELYEALGKLIADDKGNHQVFMITGDIITKVIFDEVGHKVLLR